MPSLNGDIAIGKISLKKIYIYICIGGVIITIYFKDDVSIKYGDCEDPDFFSLTCDFEDEHLCGYQSDSTANFNWVRNNGPGSTLNTGPTVDVSIEPQIKIRFKTKKL